MAYISLRTRDIFKTTATKITTGLRALERPQTKINYLLNLWPVIGHRAGYIFLKRPQKNGPLFLSLANTNLCTLSIFKTTESKKWLIFM